MRLGGELSRRLQELRYAVRQDDNRYVYKLPNTVTLSLYDDLSLIHILSAYRGKVDNDFFYGRRSGESYVSDPGRSNPVSYTHLDVYKRQQLPRSVEADQLVVGAFRRGARRQSEHERRIGLPLSAANPVGDMAGRPAGSVVGRILDNKSHLRRDVYKRQLQTAPGWMRMLKRAELRAWISIPRRPGDRPCGSAPGARCRGRAR